MTPRSATDQTLAARAAAGDDAAFEALAARHRPMLERFARSRCIGREHLADDAVQEAMIKALRALRGGSMPNDPRAWLIVIVRNCCADVRRGTPAHEEMGEWLAPIAPDVADVVERSDQLDRIVDAIDRLPASQRSMIVERELGGSTYEQLAKQHSTSVGAVKSLLVRARRNLAAQPGLRALALPALWLQRKLGATAAADLINNAVTAKSATAAVLVVAAAGSVAGSTGHLPALITPQQPAPKVAHVATPEQSSAASGKHGQKTVLVASASSPAPEQDAAVHSAAPAPVAALAAPPKVKLADVYSACVSAKGLQSGQFTPETLRAAAQKMPSDVAEYTDCGEQIRLATQAP